MTQAQARLEELLDGYPTVEKDGEKAAELLVNLFSLLKNCKRQTLQETNILLTRCCRQLCVQ